jgi:hypothetical protein
MGWGVMSKTTKALKKQAARSQQAARSTADPVAASQLSALAEAFRAQAAIIKRNKKKLKCPTP